MPGSVYHAYTSPVPDGTATSVVRPSDWNSAHLVSGIPDGISLRGNTAGVLTVVSSGTLYVAGGNNVTLSQSGNSVTVSAFNQTNQTGISGLSAGTTQVTSGTAVFSNSNGLAFGASGNTITGSYTVPSTAGLLSAVNVSAGTTSQNLTNVVFSNSNGLAFGLSGSTVTGSYTVPAVTAGSDTAGVSNLGNTAGTSGVVSGDQIRLLLAGGNNVTLSQSVNGASATITVSAFNQTTQSAIKALGASNTGNTAGNTGVSTGVDWVIAGTNNVTVSESTAVGGPNTLWLSAGGGGAGFSAGVSTGGNTSGNTGVTGTRLVLAGGNNVTVSQGTDANGATITISGANVGGAQTGISSVIASNATQTVGAVSFAASNGITFGISTGANTGTITASYTVPSVTNSSWTVSDSVTSATVGRLAFTASNGLTLTLSTSNNGNHTVIGSYTVPTQSNQTVGIYGSSQTTGSASSGTYDARSITFIGAGIVSVGDHSTSAGGTTTGVIISATQSNQAFSASGGSSAFQTLSFNNANGLTFSNVGGAVQGSYTVPTVTNSSWTVSDSVTSATVGRLAFTASNGLTLTLSTSNNGNHTVVGSYTVPSTAGLISAVNVSAGTTSNNLTNVVFSNSNGVSFGLNGSTVTATIAAQSNQSAVKALGASNTGNTLGNTGVSTGIDWVVAGTGALTVSESTTAGGPNTLWLSGATVAGQPVNFSAGTTSNNLGSVVFSNSNGVSFGLNGSTITASVNAGGGGTLSLYGVGNTSGTSSGTASGTLSISADGALTVAASNSGWGLSVPATSSLSGTGWAQISTNGSTISIGATTTANLYAVGNTFGTSSGTADPRTLSISGGGNVSVAASNSGWVISGPQLSTLSVFPDVARMPATVNSTYYSGSTSQGAGGGSTQSGYTQSIYLAPLDIDQPISFSNLRLPLSGSTAAGTGSVTVAFSVGFYSNNAGTLSLEADLYAGVFVSQNSVTAQTMSAWTQSNTAFASTYSTQGNAVSGQWAGSQKNLLFVEATSLPRGQHYMALCMLSVSTGANVYGTVNVAQASNITQALCDMGANTTVTSGTLHGWGAVSTTYTSQTGANSTVFRALPGAINLANVTTTGTGNLRYHFPMLRN